MKPRLKRIASLALAILIVAQIAVAPAAADNSIEDQVGDAACKIGSTFGPFAWMNPQCTVDYGEVDGATAEELHYNTYAQGVFMEDSRDQLVTEKLSMINHSNGIATAQAKWEILEALNNGTSKADAYQVATSTINDYYATVQKSLYVSQNRQIQQLRMVDQEIANAGELTPNDVYMRVHTGGYDNIGDDENAIFSNQTVELWDGSTMNVTTARVVWSAPADSNGNYGTHARKLSYYNGSVPHPSPKKGPLEHHPHGVSYLQFRSPTDSPDNPQTTIAIDARRFQTAIQSVSDQRDQSLSQVATLVDQIYAEYDPGEISTAEAMGPLESVVAASTNYDQTGHFSYVLQTAQQMGLSVPDAASMTVKSDFDGDGANETRDGAIFAPRGTFPNGSIAVGRTYDTATLNNPVNFVWARENEPAKQIQLSGTFTVTKAWNPQNESQTYDTVNLQSTEFATTNTTDLNQQIRNLTQAMEELREENDAPSTGGLFGGAGTAVSSFMSQLFTGVGIGMVALAVIAVLALFVLLRVYTP